MKADKKIDQKITQAIVTQLSHDKGIEDHLIDVTTHAGVVTLTGLVDNILAKERATRVAGAVKGVQAVINRLFITSGTWSDDTLKKNVESTFLRDPVVESYEINVDVENGVVSLYGIVDSWQEKQFAAKLAKGFSGVKAVENLIQVRVQGKRPDHEIEDEIEKRLSWDVWVNAELIDVSVEDGNVILTGIVGNAADRYRVYADSWVMGVTSVHDSAIRVDWDRWADMRETVEYSEKPAKEIEKAIKTAFFYDPRISPVAPNVQVENGKAILYGVVESLRVKRAAEQVARETKGVWRVKNYIRVRPKKTDIPSDSLILSSMGEVFAKDPFLERYEITIKVLNGKVYLSGLVDSNFEKSRAGDIASRIWGVVDLKNDLEVRRKHWVYKSDWEIKDDIESELHWDSRIDEDQVSVLVSDGTATLTGVVDSWLEYNAATINAYDGGAKKVINALRLEPIGRPF